MRELNHRLSRRDDLSSFAERRDHRSVRTGNEQRVGRFVFCDSGFRFRGG